MSLKNLECYQRISMQIAAALNSYSFVLELKVRGPTVWGIISPGPKSLGLKYPGSKVQELNALESKLVFHDNDVLFFVLIRPRSTMKKNCRRRRRAAVIYSFVLGLMVRQASLFLSLSRRNNLLRNSPFSVNLWKTQPNL